nr:hypothetical protein [Hephaestia mangrovi]
MLIAGTVICRLAAQRTIVRVEPLTVDRLETRRAMTKEAGAAMIFIAQKMDRGELQPVSRVDMRHALFRLEVGRRRRHQRKIAAGTSRRDLSKIEMRFDERQNEPHHCIDIGPRHRAQQPRIMAADCRRRFKAGSRSGIDQTFRRARRVIDDNDGFPLPANAEHPTTWGWRRPTFFRCPA